MCEAKSRERMAAPSARRPFEAKGLIQLCELPKDVSYQKTSATWFTVRNLYISRLTHRIPRLGPARSAQNRKLGITVICILHEING